MFTLIVDSTRELYYVIYRDVDAIREWRRSKHSFSKSMEKVSKRNEGTRDIKYFYSMAESMENLYYNKIYY